MRLSISRRLIVDEQHIISLNRKCGFAVEFALFRRVAGDRAGRHGLMVSLFGPACFISWAIIVAELLRFRYAGVNGSIRLEQIDERIYNDEAHDDQQIFAGAAQKIVAL